MSENSTLDVLRRAGRTDASAADLMPQLVAALMDAHQELLLMDGCAESAMPDFEARLPAELRKEVWRVDASMTLATVKAALDAAEAAGFAPQAPTAPPRSKGA